MRKHRITIVFTALVAVAALAVPAASSATQTVQITRSGFSPANATVTVGDSVTWHNADSAEHQVVADDGSFASPVLKTDQSFTFTPSTSGKIHYHDGLKASVKGTLTIKAAPAAVTLSAADRTVVFGSSATLTGVLSTGLAAQPIVLSAERFDQPKTVQSVATTTTAAGGEFSFTVSPTVRTAYVARWTTASSASLTMEVRPRVGLGVSGRLFTAKATSELSYGGHYVWLQRYAPALGAWVNVKRVFLGASSRARFTATLPRHRVNRVRVWLPPSQAGAGYVTSWSREVSVRR